MTSNTSSDFPPRQKLYGPMLEAHHPWCDFWTRIGPCSTCDRLYETYPVSSTDTEADLRRKYFPAADAK